MQSASCCTLSGNEDTNLIAQVNNLSNPIIIITCNPHFATTTGGFHLLIFFEGFLNSNFLLFHSAILKPNFNLCFRELQVLGQLHSTLLREVGGEVEFFLQLNQLKARIDWPWTFRCPGHLLLQMYRTCWGSWICILFRNFAKKNVIEEVIGTKRHFDDGLWRLLQILPMP